MRLRITFAKTTQMRYTSHLDLHRTWERTLRRARLPLAYSQGFNPHPHINLASALPLGFTGGEEIIDVWLEQTLSLAEVEAALHGAVPPGIEILHVEMVSERSPSLQTDLEASEYLITFQELPTDLSEQVEELLTAARIPRQRRGKNYDLRPLILDLHLDSQSPQEHPRLYVRLTAREGATGRPEEVLAALGVDPVLVTVHRKRLIFKDDDGLSLQDHAASTLE